MVEIAGVEFEEVGRSHGPDGGHFDVVDGLLGDSHVHLDNSLSVDNRCFDGSE